MEMPWNDYRDFFVSIDYCIYVVGFLYVKINCQFGEI